MKAYQHFWNDHGVAVAIVAVIFLLIAALLSIPGKTPEEKAVAAVQNALKTEWNSQCEQRAIGQSFVMEKQNIGGQLFCLQVTLIENYPIYDRDAWEAGCVALGGSYHYNNGAYKCYMKEVIEELGAQEDFGGTP